MLQKIMRRKKIVFILMLAAVTITVLAAAEPGSVEDPLISKSYIDTVLMPQIKDMIGFTTGGEGTIAESYTVVSLKKGERLICDAGCELIVRMGSAKIIATTKGGIADVTSGFDLSNNADVPSNHHLIVPVGDGRGLLSLSDMLVMVKGGYRIN